MMPAVSVIVMAYNEEASLAAVVHEITGVLAATGEPYEILVLDDGSQDGTGTIADSLTRTNASIGVLHHARNEGLGGVYRSGFALARGEFITFFPADGQFPATILAQFIPLMRGADLVLGYVAHRRVSWLTAVLSRGQRLVYRLLFGPLPRFAGIFMVRRSQLLQLPLAARDRGWTVVMEMIIRAARAGWRILSVPTELRPRAHGTSKVNNLRMIWVNFKHALLLRRVLALPTVTNHVKPPSGSCA